MPGIFGETFSTVSCEFPLKPGTHPLRCANRQGAVNKNNRGLACSLVTVRTAWGTIWGNWPRPHGCAVSLQGHAAGQRSWAQGPSCCTGRLTYCARWQRLPGAHGVAAFFFMCGQQHKSFFFPAFHCLFPKRSPKRKMPRSLFLVCTPPAAV